MPEDTPSANGCPMCLSMCPRPTGVRHMGTYREPCPRHITGTCRHDGHTGPTPRKSACRPGPAGSSSGRTCWAPAPALRRAEVPAEPPVPVGAQPRLRRFRPICQSAVTNRRSRTPKKSGVCVNNVVTNRELRTRRQFARLRGLQITRYRTLKTASLVALRPFLSLRWKAR